jgi:hypothetical protein
MQTQRNDNNWIGGLVLIVLGVLFLFQNLTGFGLGNWWAIFILLPAFAAFWTAWTTYQADGKLTHRVANLLYGGSFPFLIGVIFLFNLNWGGIWPLFLILAGLGVIFGWSAKDNEKTPQGPTDNPEGYANPR